MSHGSSNLTIVHPRHLARFLAEGEVLYVETRATKLFYFPGPIVVFLILLFLDLTAWTGFHGMTTVPYLSHEFGMIPGGYQNYVMDLLWVITALVVLWLFVRWIEWIRTIYAVSNHRIIIKRGIVSRDIDDIPMNQVRGVDVHQTVGQRMLGYGTVRVSAELGTAKSIGNEQWSGIPKPFQVQRTIETVMQSPVMPVGYPQQPAVVYAGPPPYQPPPTYPPPK